MKAGFEARLRARREKEREKALREDEARREHEERDRDLRGWAARVRGEHEVRSSCCCTLQEQRVECFLCAW
jgi:actin-related protein 5